MDIDSLTDDDLDQLASQLAGRLPTGRYGGQFVLSRRQLLSLAGGSAGIAGLTALGVDPATAQSAAGQVGTSSSPEDVFAYDLDVQNGAEFNGNDVTGVGSLSTESLSLTPVENITLTFNSGETQTSLFEISLSAIPIIPTAVPANDPGNDHAYTIDKVKFDSSAEVIRLDVSEIQNAGGGQCQIVVWSLGT